MVFLRIGKSKSQLSYAILFLVKTPGQRTKSRVLPLTFWVMSNALCLSLVVLLKPTLIIQRVLLEVESLVASNKVFVQRGKTPKILKVPFLVIKKGERGMCRLVQLDQPFAYTVGNAG